MEMIRNNRIVIRRHFSGKGIIIIIIIEQQHIYTGSQFQMRKDDKQHGIRGTYREKSFVQIQLLTVMIAVITYIYRCITNM